MVVQLGVDWKGGSICTSKNINVLQTLCHISLPDQSISWMWSIFVPLYAQCRPHKTINTGLQRNPCIPSEIRATVWLTNIIFWITHRESKIKMANAMNAECLLHGKGIWCECECRIRNKNIHNFFFCGATPYWYYIVTYLCLIAVRKRMRRYISMHSTSYFVLILLYTIHMTYLMIFFYFSHLSTWPVRWKHFCRY